MSTANQGLDTATTNSFLKFCTDCGHKLAFRGKRFCGNCGETLYLIAHPKQDELPATGSNPASRTTSTIDVTPDAVRPGIDEYVSSILDATGHTVDHAKHHHHGTRKFMTATFVISLVAVLVLPMAAQIYYGLGIQTVLTGSMRPGIQPGDAILTKVVPVTSIHKGDVVLMLPTNSKIYRAHRVVSVTRKGKAITILTKGDANPDADTRLVLDSRTPTRRVLYVIPQFGHVANFITKPAVKFSSILLLIALLTFAFRLERKEGRRRNAQTRENQ